LINSKFAKWPAGHIKAYQQSGQLAHTSHPQTAPLPGNPSYLSISAFMTHPRPQTPRRCLPREHFYFLSPYGKLPRASVCRFARWRSVRTVWRRKRQGQARSLRSAGEKSKFYVCARVVKGESKRNGTGATAGTGSTEGTAQCRRSNAPRIHRDQ